MFKGMNKHGKGSVIQISTVFGPLCNLFCGKDLLKGILQTFIESPFSEMVIWKIDRLWGSNFFWKSAKFNVDFKNAEINSEKVFCFWDNRIWNGCVKLSLYRRQYLSSSVNVLTNNLKNLQSTKMDFFQLNYAQRDEQIW